MAGNFFDWERSTSQWGSKACKVLAVLFCVGTTLASGQATGEGSSNGSGFELPITVRRVPRALARRGDVSGEVGLGNNADL
jgi:hypothetical protein